MSGANVSRDTTSIWSTISREFTAYRNSSIGNLLPPERLVVFTPASVRVRTDRLGAEHADDKETLDTYSDLFDDDLDSVAAALN